MKKIILFLGSIVLLTNVACDSLNDPGSGSTSEDKQEIKYILTEDSLIYDEMDDGAENTFSVDDPNWDTSGLPKVATDNDDYWKRAIFGRRVESRTRRVEINFTSDTTAQAIVHINFTGKFISLTGGLSGDSVIINRFTKPMEHDVERIINLAKYTDQRRDVSRVNPDRLYRWHIVSTSLGDGLSNPSTVSIVQVTIMPEGQDAIVISDPLEYMITRRAALRLPVFSEVKVQVKIKNETTNPIEHPMASGSYENVRLHYGLNRLGHHAKRPFKYVGQDDNGNQIYEGSWIVRQHPGTHHAVIDLIDNGTIFNEDNDAYPYSSATWGMPYIVTR